MSISVKSRKAKARRLQQWVAQKISDITGIECGKDEDIESREMGQSGVDIKLRGDAKYMFPFSVECFNGDTLIVTKEGMKKIKDVRIGDKVFTHKCRFRKVLNKNSRVAETIKVKSGASSEAISVTDEHLFEGFGGSWCPVKSAKYTSHYFSGNNSYETHITKLKTPKKMSNKVKLQLPTTVSIDNDLMELFGWYIAEGCSVGSRVIWTLSSDENVEAQFIADVCESKFSISPTITNNNSVNRIDASSVLLEKFFLSLLGTGSYNKKLGIFMFFKKRLLQHLIRAYFLGDGCIGQDYARCETVSRILAYEIQFALLRLGIFSRVSLEHYKNQERNNMYSVQISRSCLRRFKLLMNNMDLRFEKIEINADDRLQIYDFINSRIYTQLSKQSSKEQEVVYNLEVEEDETYIIEGGIVVHNCKNQERWSIPQWIKQAKDNRIKNTNWLLVCKSNHVDPVVIIDANEFFKMYEYVGPSYTNVISERREKDG